jgi:methylmalonyl-CoA mutase N-terminal domain/subunit
LWVNSLDQNVDEKLLGAEKFARWLKNREVEEAAKSKESVKQNVQNIITGISKFKSLREEEVKIEQSDAPQCRDDFEKEKKEILTELRSDHGKLLDRLLGDKLKV